MLRGVVQYGCNWKQIKDDTTFGPILGRRNNIKMKDKWRNMQPKAVTRSTAMLAQVFQLALPNAESKLPKGMRNR